MDRRRQLTRTHARSALGTPGARRLTGLLAAFGLLGAACSGTASLAPPTPAPALPQRLHTQGPRILTPEGREVRLLGINLQSMQSSNDDGTDQLDSCGRGWELPPDGAARDIASWGFNTVRLPVAWANIEPTAPTRASDGSLTHHWGEAYLAALDGLIGELSSHHLRVILDMAQYQWTSAFKESGAAAGQVNCEGYGMPSWLYPDADAMTIPQAKCDFVSNRPQPGVELKPWDGLTDVWTMLGERYADNPAVIAADVMNEPYFQPEGCTGADFAGFYRTLGETVRAVAPDWLLIFEYFPPANALFGITSPPPFENQIYSVHVYTRDWTAAERFLSPGLDQARSWGMPMLVGEFDGFGEARATGGRPNWQQDTQSMLDWMRQKGVSWTFFGYAGGLSVLERDGRPKAELIQILQDGF